MQKCEKKKQNGSLSFLILRTYSIFFALVLLMAVVLVMFYRYLTYNVLWDNPINITKHTEILRNEQYEKLPVKRELGNGGYIEVLDENAHIVYSGKSGPVSAYSKSVLEFIPDIDSGTFYMVNNLKNSDESSYTVIERANSDTDEFYLDEVMIVNADGEVLYTTDPKRREVVTDQEISYISGQAGDRTYIQKYGFRTKEGQMRYLLIHTVDHTIEYSRRQDRTTLAFVLLFLVGLLILILFAVARISHTVLRPLNLLKNAMENLSQEREKYGGIEKIDYNGPRELTAICDSFNDMADDLRESEERREKLEKDRQKMLADISHDIKTPVTVIDGYAQALESGLVPEKDVNKYLREIKKKSEILSELVNSFYEYSRLDHPGFKLDIKKADLAEYFRAYLAEKYEELELNGFDVDIDIPEEIIKAEFDAFQLKRVFENIINNAMKHNSSGCTIFGTMEVKDKNFVIRLGDNGRGIPEALRDKIFDPFVVGEEARVSGRGTGLGLSIAQKIVEAHGWKIRLLTEVDGTMFAIYGKIS